MLTDKQTAAREAREALWICAPCALRAGAAYIPGHCSTFHTDVCGVCRRRGTVTEPRDFAWQLDLFDE